jgi:hypothetical protein
MNLEEKSKSQYSQNQLKRARELYLAYEPISSIMEETGIKRKALLYHIGQKWKPEREAKNAEIVDAMTDSRRVDLLEITKYGLTYLKKSLEKLVKESEVNPSPGLLKTISTIVFEINKIKALDENRPTEIIAELKPASIIEVKQMLAKDPFLEIEDAEVVEDKSENL